MHTAQNTYQKTPIEVSLTGHIENFYIDLSGFCFLLLTLMKQKLFSDSKVESHNNQENLPGTTSEAIATLSNRGASYLEANLLVTITKKIRKWMVCMSRGGWENKKFNEESNYYTFIRESEPDRPHRKWGARSIIYRVGGKPTYGW
ncbi:MAG: hypothetical protein RLN81_07265 [Balneolaceae bacterium]